ncbi:tetratricopeptide repeat protein 16 isoform X2 [Macaca fascicularis]|uniref:tetratricopeptide repeat protein 16 isoform X2 n=1 Tax=Macaca fascicularis TaxID=9541 RepID=UPI003D15BA3E
MTDSDEDALKVDQGPSQDIPKPWVIPAPKGILQHIFGTSQVFQSICDVKPKVTGLTVPLKVREYYSRGQQCLEQADWETAVLFFSRALHLDPQLGFRLPTRGCSGAGVASRIDCPLCPQGQCLFEQCAFLDALNVFSHAAELQPEKACFRYRCMACLLALKQHPACLSLITEELKQDTTNADVYILRARLYNFLQKPHLCYRDLHGALLLNPKHPQARKLLQKMVAQAQQARQDAGILAVQGRLQHALQRINCAIENNPLDPSFFLFRGTMYRRLQEFDGAVEDFLKVLDMVTEDQEDMVRQAQRQLLLTYNDFAVHCYRQGAYQEGVLLLNKALRDEQQEKGLYINRGGAQRPGRWGGDAGSLTIFKAPTGHLRPLRGKEEGREEGSEGRGNVIVSVSQEHTLGNGTLDRLVPDSLKCSNRRLGNSAQTPRKLEGTGTVTADGGYQPPVSGPGPGAGADWAGPPRHWELRVHSPPPPDPRLLLPAGQPGLCRGRLPAGAGAEPAGRGRQHAHGPAAGEDGVLRAEAQMAELMAARNPLCPAGSSRRQRTTSPRPSGTTPRRPSTTCTGPRAGSCCRTFLGHARMWPLSCSSTPSNQRMLKQWELERQKALALQRSWKQGEPLIETSEKLQATPEIPQVEPGSSEGQAEAPKEEEEKEEEEQKEEKEQKEEEKKEEKKPKLTPSKVASLSESYLDQTSLASSMSFRTTCTSETETSAICQEYRSTSATAMTFSDSSLLKTQSSDSGNNREALSHGPRKIKDIQGQRQSLSKTQATQSQRQNFSKTKAAIHRRNSSKTKATQGQGRRSSKTEATQGQRQSSSEIETSQGPRQEPSKTKTTRSPRQRPRKVKAARGRSWRPSKLDATQGRSRGLLRSSTKTEAFYDSNWSLSKTEDVQGQGQRTSKAEAAQGKSRGMSSTSSKAESTWGPSPSVSKTEVGQDLTYYEAL